MWMPLLAIVVIVAIVLAVNTWLHAVKFQHLADPRVWQRQFVVARPQVGFLDLLLLLYDF